jgi:protein SCO1/2
MQPPLAAGDQVPDATFTDQDGKALEIASLRGTRWALTFVYTRCPLPTFCPALDQRFQVVQRAIAADRALAGARLVSITIDPDYDTPGVLRAHAARLRADPAVWRFVTGERDAIDRFGQRLGLTVQRGSGAPEDVVHSLRTAVVDAKGRLVRVFEGTEWAPADVLSALRGAAR